MSVEMTHRQRVLAALNHEQSDRVPMDLGATYNSSIVIEPYQKLKNHFGLNTPTELCSRMLRTAVVEEEILKALDIDVRGVYYGHAAPVPQDDLPERAYRDEWSIVRERPRGSFYYDQRNYPLAGSISLSDIAKYPHPDPDHPGWIEPLQPRLKWIKENTDCAVAVQVPAPFVHLSQYLRGYEDWYMDFIADPARLTALFDYCLEFHMIICRRILEEVGPEVDIVCTADDLGAQKSLQVSPDHFRKFIKPGLKKYFQLIHDLSPAKLMFHTCGSVDSILDDLADIGVEIINPVQVSAAGMDPVSLKSRFGKRLCFWGGIDTVRLLPEGSEEEVKAEVRKTIDILGQGGGYVLNAVHSIQPDVPVENILALYAQGRSHVRDRLRQI